ncbi:MAG: hypothetical protein ACLUNQ_06860 [Oscillospiraceae bacterium]
MFKSSALLSAQQAKRDAVLAFSQAVQKEFEKLLASDISKALDEKALADLIQRRPRGRTPPPMPPRSPRSPTASVPSWPGSWRQGWKFARLRRWGPGSAWPPRTAPAISTARRRRSPGCSTPSSGTHACKGVPAWLPITISSPASPCCAPEASRPWTTPSFCASARTAVSPGVYETLATLTVSADHGPFLSQWAEFYQSLSRELTYQRSVKLGRPCPAPYEPGRRASSGRCRRRSTPKIPLEGSKFCWTWSSAG